MFKKMMTASLALALVLALAACTKTFDGYYNTLGLAREEVDCYNKSDYVFTAQAEGLCLDFVIGGGSVYIVVFLVKGENDALQYKVSSIEEFSLSEQIALFEAAGDYRWKSSSALAEKEYRWCIVTKNFHAANNNIDCFEFTYKEATYCLCCDFG